MLTKRREVDATFLYLQHSRCSCCSYYYYYHLLLLLAAVLLRSVSLCYEGRETDRERERRLEKSPRHASFLLFLLFFFDVWLHSPSLMRRSLDGDGEDTTL